MSNSAGNPIDLHDFIVTDTFWKHEMELIRREVLPYQWNILNDRVPDAAPSFCMHNFQVAGNMNTRRKAMGSTFEEPKYTFRGFEILPEDPNHLEDRFYGFVFQDSDFSKWIEAVAYSLSRHADPELEAIADEAIDVVCEAQLDNGYLDTYYIINGRDKIFTNLRDHHELYCFGHLTEGAVAYFKATGKEKLLQAAIRFADFVASRFGKEEEKLHGYPGHEIAEMALVRLYEVTGDQKYLELCQYFIDQRGMTPNYFTQVEKHEDETKLSYYQAHIPVREQKEAVGHAVRAMYLYAGMADIARLTNDQGLFEACRNLWENVTSKKMYITGGVGGTHIGESFSYAYDLPSDTAYSETCAAIGLIFWARRMLSLEAKSEYADVMERALYNNVLAGIALDGKSFFYTNPLSVNPESCRKDERISFIKPTRQKWFGCACCPPNISRLISSLPTYAYTEREDTLFVHLYIGGIVRKTVHEKLAEFRIQSEYPRLKMPSANADGGRGHMSTEMNSPSEKDRVHITYTGDDSVQMTIALRIPGFCDGFEILAYGKKTHIQDGYVYVCGKWKQGDEIDISIYVTTKLIQAEHRVRELYGKSALMHGPVVYCLEAADNGPDLYLYKIKPEQTEKKGRIMIDQNICETFSVNEVLHEKKNIMINGNDFMGIQIKGIKELPGSSRHLYREYQPVQVQEETLTYIPYFTWANRGENEMEVWMPLA